MGGMKRDIRKSIPENSGFYSTVTRRRVAYMCGCADTTLRPAIYISHGVTFNGKAHTGTVGRYMLVEIEGAAGRCGLPLFGWDSI